MNKRGQLPPANLGENVMPWKRLLGFIILAIIITAFFVLWSKYHESCVITEEEILRASEGSNLQYIKNWFKENALYCEKKMPSVIEHPLFWVKETLGFNKGMLDFIPDLVTGLFVGLWIYLVFVLARLEVSISKIPIFGNILSARFKRLENLAFGLYEKKLQMSWLGFIGGAWWKIIPIGVGYAVLMQIPILNTAISVITFEQLLALKETHWIWNALIKSFILAFYFGFFPAAIEGYSRYRIKKKYYEAIQFEKYLKKKQRIEMES